jgi:hypothetical protein
MFESPFEKELPLTTEKKEERELRSIDRSIDPDLSRHLHAWFFATCIRLSPPRIRIAQEKLGQW